MQSTSLLIVVVIFAYGFVRLASRLEAVTSDRLRWWQKLMSIVALMLVVIIAANPELWALGLLGDTAFLDVFVLLMSIQLQMVVFWACRLGGTLILRGWRWLIAPRPYLLYLWATCAVVGAVNAVITMWKAMQRMAARGESRPFESSLFA